MLAPTTPLASWPQDPCPPAAVGWPCPLSPRQRGHGCSAKIKREFCAKRKNQGGGKRRRRRVAVQRKIYRPYLSPFFSPPKRGSGLPACRLSGAYNTPTRRDGLGRGHIYISDHCDNLENLAPEAATNAARLEELPQKSQQLSIFTMGDKF